MAYWNTEEDRLPTYHTLNRCPSGRRINPKVITVGYPPKEWVKCAICRRLDGIEPQVGAE